MNALKLYFPSRFTFGAEARYYYTLKKHLMAQLECIVDGNEENEKNLKISSREFQEETKPILYDSSPDSMIIKRRKEQEMLKITLQKAGFPDTDDISVFGYYTLLEQAEEEKSKAKTRNTRNNNHR